jgi:hypothetical protein
MQDRFGNSLKNFSIKIIFINIENIYKRKIIIVKKYLAYQKIINQLVKKKH